MVRGGGWTLRELGLGSPNFFPAVRAGALPQRDLGLNVAFVACWLRSEGRLLPLSWPLFVWKLGLSININYKMVWGGGGG